MGKATTTNSEKKRLSQISKERSLSAFQTTARETSQPIKVSRLWRYTLTKILVLGTDDNLYIMNGLRRYKLHKLDQPLDKGWTSRELIELNNTMDDAKFAKVLEKIAKDRGTTPEETLKQLRAEAHEIFDIDPEEEAKRERGLEEYEKSEEFRKWDEYIGALTYILEKQPTQK